MTTIEVLKKYVTKELLNGRANQQLNNDDNILTTGLIDSLGIMRLVAFIEEEFSTQVPPEDVTIDNFRTIGHIANYLQERSAA